MRYGVPLFLRVSGPNPAAKKGIPLIPQPWSRILRYFSRKTTKAMVGAGGRGAGGFALGGFVCRGLGSLARVTPPLLCGLRLSCYFNPFTTGNPFWGTKLLGFSIGRGSGALKGLMLLYQTAMEWLATQPQTKPPEVFLSARYRVTRASGLNSVVEKGVRIEAFLALVKRGRTSKCAKLEVCAKAELIGNINT